MRAVPANDGAWPAGAAIGAVGLIESSTEEVKIGTNISGIVETVLVVPGVNVEKGDSLFVLDQRMAKALVMQRIADVHVAESRLDLAKAKIESLQASVIAARHTHAAALSELEEAHDLMQIGETLRPSAAITVREITRRRNAYRTAKAKVDEAAARVVQAEADLALYDKSKNGALIRAEEIAVEQARTAQQTAETELSLRMVRAPVSGTILQVNIRPGEFAQAGVLVQPLIVLGRLDPLHVRVEIDEASIVRFDKSARATAARRGEGDRPIALRYVRTEPLVIPKRSLSGIGIERVDTRVLQVIYAIDDRSPRVFPGQIVDVYIEATKEGSIVSTGNRP
jgi:HlyD family secretion protein